MRPALFSIAMGLGCVAPVVRADVMTISSSLTGGFDAFGGYSNTLAFQNYFTGSTSTGPQPDRRSFFIFELPPMPPVISASLVLRNPWVPFPEGDDGTPGYFSDDAFETFRLSDTPFPAAYIASPHTTPEALGIWATLGSGTLFGEAHVSPASGPEEDLVIPLTGAALAAINAHLGSFFVLGGQVSSLDGTSPDELIFGYSDIPSPHMVEPRLSLTFIPAPGAAVSLGGVALVSASRRRR